MKSATQRARSRTSDECSDGGRQTKLPAVFDFAYWRRSQPTLIVDRNAVTAKQLAEQLSHRGFEADFVLDYFAAESAVRTKYYRSIIIVIESDEGSSWGHLSALRKHARGSWIIVATPSHDSDTHDKLFRLGGDSLLATPLSVEDLTTRLSAFSLRSRPV